MILGFNEYFDNEKKEPTNFVGRIASGMWENMEQLDIPDEHHPHTMAFASDPTFEGWDQKLHSIRKGFRWKPGTLIQFATGVGTPDYYCFAHAICKSVQSIQMIFLSDKSLTLLAIDDTAYIKRDLFDEGKPIEESNIAHSIAHNDGLTIEQFRDWFFGASLFDANLNGYVFEGQIINWTDLKY